MKTVRKVLVLTVLGGLLSTASAFAQPPSKRLAPAAPVSPRIASASIDTGNPALTCAFMRMPSRGAGKRAKWVRCTSERLQNDARCRAYCERRSSP